MEAHLESCDDSKLRNIREFLDEHPEFQEIALQRAIREQNVVQAERLVKSVAAGLRNSSYDTEKCRVRCAAFQELDRQLIWLDVKAKRL